VEVSLFGLLFCTQALCADHRNPIFLSFKKLMPDHAIDFSTRIEFNQLYQLFAKISGKDKEGQG
jgi:hypothetical protein